MSSAQASTLIDQAIATLQAAKAQLDGTPAPVPTPAPTPTPTPPPTRQPGYVTLGNDPTTAMPVYECDTVNGPPPMLGYYLAGYSIGGIGPGRRTRGAGLPVYAPNGAQPDFVAFLIANVS